MLSTMASCKHLAAVDEPMCVSSLPGESSVRKQVDEEQDCGDYLIPPESSEGLGIERLVDSQEAVEQFARGSLSSPTVRYRDAPEEGCSKSNQDSGVAMSLHAETAVDKTCQDIGFAVDLENGFLPELDNFFNVECAVNTICLDEIESSPDDNVHHADRLSLENVEYSAGNGFRSYLRESQLHSEEQLATASRFLVGDEINNSVKDAEVAPEKSDTGTLGDSCNQVLPSQAGLKLSRLETVNVSTSDSTLHINTKDVEGSLVEKVTDSSVGKSDVSNGGHFLASERILPNMERHGVQGVSSEAFMSSDRQSHHEVFLQPCDLKNVVDYSMSNSLSALDVSGLKLTDAVALSTPASLSQVPENDGVKHVEFDDVSDIRSNENVFLRRSCRQNKSVPKTPELKCATNSGKPTVDETTDRLAMAVRRKRSCVTKSSRSVAWGFLSELLQRFQQSNSLNANENLKQGSRKAKGGRRKKTKSTPQETVNSQKSGGGKGGVSGPIRLKVTFGGRVAQGPAKKLPPSEADVSAGLCSGDGDDKTLLSGTRTGASVAIGMAENFQITGSGEPLKKPISRQDDCVEVHPSECDLDNNFTSSKSVGDQCRISSHMEAEKSGGSNGDGYVELGTSPDSEVINQIPDCQLRTMPLEFSHDPALTSSNAVLAPDAVSDAPLPRVFKKRAQKKKGPPADNNNDTDDNICRINAQKVITSEECQQQPDMGTGFFSTDKCISASSGNASSNGSGSELISAVDEDSNIGLRVDMCHKMDVAIESAELRNSKLLPAGSEGHGIVLPKGSRPKGKTEKKSKLSGKASRQKDSSRSRKGNKKTSATKSSSKENEMLGQVHKVDVPVATVIGNHGQEDVGKSTITTDVMSGDVFNNTLVPCGVAEQTLPPRKAWVCCDDCQKWRCIPAVLADKIEGMDCRWTCKDNQDKAFADCSVLQEKSNSEINAELELSDASGDEGNRGRAVPAVDGCVKNFGLKHAPATQPASWTLIRSNVFLHRKRKSQSMDEIMVCHCKPPVAGGSGCGDECLNRMLNIECTKETCPCGDACSNRQFQRRKYAKLKWFRSGKKGYGLQAQEKVSQGKFVIEYVGEVLDLPAYEARQKEYASKGHKHFYFMTLNGNEVIDACAKGNLGRFINHSCDPNCRTEKWMVNGEICVGLFAIRDIKKGEELTFDYNYVRVFGAAAKKCHCGASQCRGYIGGDPLTAGDIVVQDDSDEEFPEPQVVYGNGETAWSLEVIMSMADLGTEHTSDLPRKEIQKTDTGGCEEEKIVDGKETFDIAATVAGVNTPPEILEALQTEGVSNLRLSAASEIELETTGHLTLNEVTGKSLADPDVAVEERPAEVNDSKKVHPKPRSRTKVSRASKTAKSRKSCSSIATTSKVIPFANSTLLQSCKPKKIPEGPNHHLESVEEKLNELLDVDGGICKRKKDASKGYLKLLLLTAASGDSGHGGAIQSNRELSMILDAILKTNSRKVLVDIINKNGLQMLHNMMKQYRQDFKKIPILRKLLKVIEFLAEKEILISERINAPPPCFGAESFRQTVLRFTEHEDRKVHQIARNFRDRWIPRTNRKLNMEKGERRNDFKRSSNSHRFRSSHQRWHDQGARPSEAVDSTTQSVPQSSPAEVVIPDASSYRVGVSATTAGRVRKRKSRWDQDAVPKSPRHNKEQKVQEGLDDNSKSGSQLQTCEIELSCANEVRKEKDNGSCLDSNQEQIDCGRAKCEREETEGAPPGFSSPLDGRTSCASRSTAVHGDEQNLCHLKWPSEMGTGNPQERFNSRLPVAYGVPMLAMEQYGTPLAEMCDQWLIAPGVSFHPFPPLPPYPRASDWGDTSSHPLVKVMDHGAPSTSDVIHVTHQGPGTNDINKANFGQRQQDFGGYYGGRCFRQQKFHSSKLRRPLFSQRNGKRFKGDRDRAFGLGIVEQNQQQMDVDFSVGYAGNSC